MHHRPRAGSELNRLEPFILGQIQRHHKATINVASLGRHREGLSHFHDEIGFAELPTRSELGQRRQFRRIAFGRTGFQPLSKRINLLYRESPVAVDGKVFFTNDNGETFVIRAGIEFEVLHVNDIGERTLASPALVDGKWYIRTRQNLIAIGE